jgi:putative PIN family toxin of toxin-antitoxin system
MSSNLRIVLDTNVFLVSLLEHHKYYWVFEGILSQAYTLLLSNEIITEYFEQCAKKYGYKLSNERLEFLLEFSNVELITPYFHWDLMQNDPDDNKFVDCYVAGQADFLVTHDKHFAILKEVKFPIINTIKIEEFKVILEKNPA